MARAPRENFQAEEALLAKQRASDQVARDVEVLELREILIDPRVRRFLWRMMAKAGMFKTHFSQNAAIMGHNTGLADMGNAILNEVLEANPEAWIVMQQDAYRKQIDEIAAAQALEEQSSSE